MYLQSRVIVESMLVEFVVEVFLLCLVVSLCEEETRGVHSLLYFAYTCVSGPIYLGCYLH